MRDALRWKRIRPPPHADEDFRALVKEAHANDRRALSLASTPQEQHAQRIYLYQSALALLTYGELDVLADIFANTPEPGSPLWALESAVGWLLPLPEGLNVHRDRDAILAWVEAHRDRLRWNELQGRFEHLP